MSAQDHGAKLTPSEVRSDIYPILGYSSEQSFTVSPEILNPISVVDRLIDWHIRFIHDREPVFCHTVDFISTPSEIPGKGEHTRWVFGISVDAAGKRFVPQSSKPLTL